MAWGFISELPMSRDDYDRLNAEIPDEPQGLILHTASEKADGTMRIVDVWESKEAYERFEQETLMPAWSRIGGDPPPEGGAPPRDEFEVHNMRGPAAG